MPNKGGEFHECVNEVNELHSCTAGFHAFTVIVTVWHVSHRSEQRPLCVVVRALTDAE
jgi:hypothetical protein